MKPTHRFKVLNKTTNDKAEIGAGWLNPDGSVSVVINECVVLQNNKDRVYTLFPIQNKNQK